MDPTNVSSAEYTTTPLRSDGNGSGLSSRRQFYDRTSSNPYKTPVRLRSNYYIPKSSCTRTSVIETLPIYSPPPKQLGNFIQNPFEHGKFLKEKLSQPTCSPSLFQNIVSPNETDNFSWSIDDISLFRPAQIDENPCQDFHSWFSPATENEAQAAIDKFFASQTSLVSPKVVATKHLMQEDRSVPVSTTRSTQTELSLPPRLPRDVEDVLRRFCMLPDAEQQSEDLDTSSNSTSRKKLCFNEDLTTATVDDSLEDEADSYASPLQKWQEGWDCRDALGRQGVRASPDWSPITVDRRSSAGCHGAASPLMMETSDLSRTTLLGDQQLNQQGCSTPRKCPDGDSAFSSM